ncbi:MAG: AAA family ATPase [Planctomycetota bacterium]|nr:AAA family ATPase [Planctomycetota bacterium]
MLNELSDELKLLIRSRHPIISIETSDEERALALVSRVAADMERLMFEWSVTTGLLRRRPSAGGPIANTESAKHALAFVHDSTLEAVYVFKDLSPHLKDATELRRLKDIHSVLTTRRATLCLVETSGALPDAVRRLTVPFDVKWPSADELKAVVRETLKEVRTLNRTEVKLSRFQTERLIQTLQGLTRREAAQVVATALHDDYALNVDDLPRIADAKRKLLVRHGVLEPITIDVTTDEIGGLNRLKRWLKERSDGFTERAKEFGLTPPRGFLLLGVQGCGKSLCAKIVAGFWGLPLLRLDPGVLYQKFVGETEARLRRALSQVEAMSPAVLWIDEIEKAFASATDGSADGGLSQRMFGSLLSWMQDHRQPVFIVATANDITRLPPELLRKGRFDEVFFVDLPDDGAREKIFAIHLRRRERDPAKFDLKRLAAASDGFSGAEIEQAIISALYGAFADKCDIDTDRLARELENTRPLSVLMKEKLAALRSWAHERCVPAD